MIFFLEGLYSKFGLVVFVIFVQGVRSGNSLWVRVARLKSEVVEALFSRCEVFELLDSFCPKV